MSNLVIEVLSTTTSTHPTAKGSYQVCEVAYKNKTFQDKVEGKKIMSFAEKVAFETLKDATTGQVFTISRQKDDKGYWKWVDVLTGEQANKNSDPVSVNTNVGGSTMVNKSPKSTYETPEERAARQVMIVRQSSISSAVALAAASGKTKVTKEDIIDTAKFFEDYVMGNNVSRLDAAISGLIDLQDDIPE